MNLWPPFEYEDLQPPIARPLPGRPKKRRRHVEGEAQPRTRTQSTTKRCKSCNAFVHNKRTCPAALTLLANIGSSSALRGRGHGHGCPRGGLTGGMHSESSTPEQGHEELVMSQPDFISSQPTQPFQQD